MTGRKKGGVKTGGRKKGTPNKATQGIREWINDFLNRNINQIEKDWKKLEPKERVQAFQQLFKYVLPTLQSTTISSDFDSQIKDLSNEQLDQLMDKILDHYNKS